MGNSKELATALVKILDTKLADGIVQLEKANISTPQYERLLSNIISTMTLLGKLTYTPQKPEGK